MQPKVDYDIGAAFDAIEKELISSMIRNMDRHRAEEDDEGILWSQWQAEQLKALEVYKISNRKYEKQFRSINRKIDQLIRLASDTGYMDQEIEILEAIKKGFKGYKRVSGTLQGEFFQLNERKLDALIKATIDDMKKAETAVLRMANDQYRKIIFNAQVYANTGAGTYEKAVDMATKDMLAAGLNCVEYSNGARHTLADYADMAIRTASKRAYLQGEGTKRQEWGISTVILNKRGDNPCPKCLPFVGKVLIDDVWSGGSSQDGPYPLMSTAIAAGLYHPRCKDSHTTYFPGITIADDTWTREELEEVDKAAKKESKQQYAKRQQEKYERLSEFSLDPQNKQIYERKAEEWKGFGKALFRTGNKSSEEYAESKRPLGNFRATPTEKVVKLLRSDYSLWKDTLTDFEEKAIRKYSQNTVDSKENELFRRINAMLRGEIKSDEVLERYSEGISSALRRGKLKRDVICYRGVDTPIYIDKKAGDIFVESQFMSTSVTQGGMLKKPYRIVIYAKKGTRAAYIEELSAYPKQRELLIDKNTVFRVISKQKGIIELEVI